jgi:hypothetical protein
MVFITSNKIFSEGHRKRYELALKLKAHYKDKLILCGQGIQEVKDKWDVLAPSQFAIAMENTHLDDYVTEKLFDCYLAYCFPIYMGAPNIGKYFSSESYLSPDPGNWDGLTQALDLVLDDPRFYEEHLPAITQARTACLDEYQFFPLAVRWIKSIDPEVWKKSLQHRRTTQLKAYRRDSSYLKKIFRKLKSFF